jgi:hypothetical protein
MVIVCEFITAVPNRSTDNCFKSIVDCVPTLRLFWLVVACMRGHYPGPRSLPAPGSQTQQCHLKAVQEQTTLQHLLIFIKPFLKHEVKVESKSYVD